MFVVTHIDEFLRIDYCANIKGLFKTLHCRKMKLKKTRIS